MKNEEKQALNQFIEFCKLQVRIDNLYKDNAGYSILILNALGFDTGALIVKQSEIDNKLNNVLKNDENKKSFLSFFARIGNNDYQRVYFMVKPATDSYYRSKIQISAKDAKILTNYILNNYKHIQEQPKDVIRETENEEPIFYTSCEKGAVFKGGNSKLNEYIRSNLTIPKSAQEFSGNVIILFVVSKEGSVINIEIKSRTGTEIPTELKAEIERVFTNMPKWTPAICGGNNSNSRLNYQMNFVVGE
jgi:hypothetical protein